MHLEKLSTTAPPGAAQMLLELADGQSGFGGTSFGQGRATLAEFLQSCLDDEDPNRVHPTFVPQTIFWMIDEDGLTVGMLRVRHRLNQRLIESGGNIGYYVRPSERGKGYAKTALGLAVNFLKSIGVQCALVTMKPTNVASAKVALANGGILDRPGKQPDTGETMLRYWIGHPKPPERTGRI